MAGDNTKELETKSAEEHQSMRIRFGCENSRNWSQ